ncbi:iron reductase [Rhizobium sp. Root708]|uniref:siderophore-iron reductase FhuF n=1 Tax=Rhizobium sp. Root708 TaxID=1736592 RepID=UPI0006F672EC|nr:siderophore-iron reductase FhuF [Rhizobium sp. Root708]KRB58731.1 iron reductase [Rhizobium sp. Root708]
MANAARHIAPMESEPVGLSPAFVGDHAWCQERMMLSAELPDGIPLPAFFAAGGDFERAIERYMAKTGGTDRRAVVSMWSLYYFSGLTIPYLLARRLAKQSLPVDFSRMTIALHEDGLPRAFGVPHAGTTRAATDDSFESVSDLMETHLNETVARLKGCGLSAKLCWNNAAVYIDYVMRLTSADKSMENDLPLFIRGCLPDGGVNPFCGCVRYVEDEGEHVARRKICCMRYLLPGVPSCGKRCALPSQRKPS